MTQAVCTWIFDLDNTLHDAETYIFPEMNRKMSAYIARHLGVDMTEADRLREAYWHAFGGTVVGLAKHGKLDYAHFLHETHHYPNLKQLLLPMAGVRTLLARLPGRKILYTNADHAYAQAVLRHLQIEHLFDGIVALQQARFKPKPYMAGYRGLLKRYRLDPRRCIMVEDSRANLITAKRLGLRTVWLNRGLRAGPAVDRRIVRLQELWRLLGA